MSSDRSAVLAPVDQDLKVGSRDLVAAYGGQEAAARLLGRRQQHVSDCGLRNVDRFLTIKDVAALEDRTAGQAGHPIVTRVLARRQGFALVKLPELVPDGADMVGMLGTLNREFGEATSKTCAAVADGKLTQAEARVIEDEFDDLIEQAVLMKSAVGMIARGEL